jgi:DNA-damage-inducible protein J
MRLVRTGNVTPWQATRQRGIPFKIEADPFWSERNQARLEKSRQEAEAGRLTKHNLIEVE